MSQGASLMLDVNERASFRAEELFRDLECLCFSGFRNSINVSHLQGMKGELMGALQSGFQLPTPVPYPLRNVSVRQPHWQNTDGVRIQDPNSPPYVPNTASALPRTVTLTFPGSPFYAHQWGPAASFTFISWAEGRAKWPL